MRLPRPSAPLAVSFLALFVALGGVSWAAIHIPPHSVGNAQLQNGSVGNAKLRPFSVSAGKIIPGAVGATQVNSNQVQLRIAGPCTDGAMQSVAQSGDVTCTQALPIEYGTQPQTAPLGANQQQIAAVSLPTTQMGSSYLAFGTVRVTDVEGTGSQAVDVSCTMSLPSGSSAQGDFDANLGGANATDASGTIPLVLPVRIAGSPQMLSIACAESATPASPAPTVNVTATIHAVQTAGNDDN